jgi:hypothetical protein
MTEPSSWLFRAFIFTFCPDAAVIIPLCEINKNIIASYPPQIPPSSPFHPPTALIFHMVSPHHIKITRRMGRLNFIYFPTPTFLRNLEDPPSNASAISFKTQLSLWNTFQRAKCPSKEKMFGMINTD